MSHNWNENSYYYVNKYAEYRSKKYVLHKSIKLINNNNRFKNHLIQLIQNDKLTLSILLFYFNLTQSIKKV